MKRVEERVAVAAMAVLVVVTAVNVLVRYFSDQSFAWTEEISIALMVVMTLAGAAAAAGGDRHIRIEYFYEQGSPRRRRVLARCAVRVTAGFFLLLAVLSARVSFDEVRYGESSMGLGVPRWIYSVWVPLLCLLIAWRALEFGRRVGRGDPPDRARDDA